MNVASLVTLANQIADFFVAEAGADAAPREIAAHIEPDAAKACGSRYIR